METYEICGTELHACRCILPKGHPEEEAHSCNPEECGGQWYGDETFFLPITLPLWKLPCPFTYQDYLDRKDNTNDGGRLRYL